MISETQSETYWI